jgi:hypothetical protein
MGRKTKRANCREEWQEAVESYRRAYEPAWLARAGARTLRILPDTGRKRAEARKWQS